MNLGNLSPLIAGECQPRWRSLPQGERRSILAAHPTATSVPAPSSGLDILCTEGIVERCHETGEIPERFGELSDPVGAAGGSVRTAQPVAAVAFAEPGALATPG